MLLLRAFLRRVFTKLGILLYENTQQLLHSFRWILHGYIVIAIVIRLVTCLRHANCNFPGNIYELWCRKVVGQRKQILCHSILKMNQAREKSY